MLKIGRRRRNLSGAQAKYGSPVVSGPGVLAGKARTGIKHDPISGEATTFPAVEYIGRPAPIVNQITNPMAGAQSRKTELKGASKEKLIEASVSAHAISAADCSNLGVGGSSGPSFGSGIGVGNNSGSQTYYNFVVDDLARGTVAEDWIPLNPVRQNQMFRMMYARGAIEGPVVDTISELVWGGDFEFTGIRDREILDTLYAAKEETQIHKYMEFLTKDYLVIGRTIAQLFLDASKGIWTEMTIYNPDFVAVAGNPRTGRMPKLDLLPDPLIQAWVKSQDPRDIDSRKGMPKALLDMLGQQKPVPLDPKTTAYLPRQAFYNDFMGHSFFVRNIPLWGLEKSLINATLTGHRRRAGPITQIRAGSDEREAQRDEMQALLDSYVAAESDNVSSAIVTRHDVEYQDIRTSLSDMWKWQDEIGFLLDLRYKMFGVNEALVTGDSSFDLTQQPTVFVERMRAHRRFFVENFLINKFCKALAVVHDWRRRSKAELDHRIRVKGNDYDLILPTISFYRNLDVTADPARADLLERMEEKGLPVTSDEWSHALGGGDVKDRMQNGIADLKFKLQGMQFQAVRAKIQSLQESSLDVPNLQAEIAKLLIEVNSLMFVKDDAVLHVEEMTKDSRERAMEIEDGIIDDGSPEVQHATHVDNHTNYVPTDTTVRGSAENTLTKWSLPRDKNLINKDGSAF